MPHPDALPNVERAFIPPAKLAGYSLNPAHDDGGSDKARVFSAVFGFTQDHCIRLRRESERQAMTEIFQLYDRVESLVDLPAFGVKSGAVGTIVDPHPGDAFEVDFGLDASGNIVTAGLDASEIIAHRVDVKQAA